MKLVRISLPKKGKPSPARLVFYAGLALMLVWLCVSTVAAQSTPLPEESYWQLVADTQAWIDTNPQPETWSAQAERWSAFQEVRLADGSVVRVSTHEIARLLQAVPADRVRLRDYLSGLLQARERWSKSGSGESELSALQSILSRPEFQSESDNFLQRLYQKVMDFLIQLLDKLFPHTRQITLPLPTDLVILLTVLLLGGILAFIFRDVWRNVLPETDLGDENLAVGEILTASQASQRARQLSSSGDYRQAIRYMYLSALLHLDERGLLRYDRSLTNREYLRQVSNQPGLASHLRPVIEIFDKVWYGFQPVDEETYSQYTGQVETLENPKE